MAQVVCPGFPNLWLSGWETANDSEFHQRHNIEARLSLLDDDDPLWQGNPLRIALRLWVPDGSDFEPWHARAAIEFLESAHRDARMPTLVHSHSGLSRSVGVLAVYLARNPKVDCSEFRADGTPEGIVGKIREVRGLGLAVPHTESVWKACLAVSGE